MSYQPIQNVITRSSASLTRPANTTAYASGQIVGDTGAAALSFTNVIQVAGIGGQIIKSNLRKNNTTTTNASFRLYLFNADPGTSTDQTTFAPSYATLANYVGFIDYVNPVVGTTSTVFTGIASDSILSFNLTSGTTLFGQLTTTAAYTPASGELMAINISTIS